MLTWLKQFGWRVLHWLGRIFKKLAIYTLVFIIGAQIIFFALNLYEKTVGAPTFEGPPIPYKQLASEQSHPYSFASYSTYLRKDRSGNYVYSDRNARLERVVKKFPNVRSCLHYSQREKELPDLRRIDFTLLDNTIEFDVCLYRIFTSIQNHVGVFRWMDDHKMLVDGFDPENSCAFSTTKSTKSCRGFFIAWFAYRSYYKPIRIFYAWNWRSFGYHIWNITDRYTLNGGLTIVRFSADGEHYQVDTPD